MSGSPSRSFASRPSAPRSRSARSSARSGCGRSSGASGVAQMKWVDRRSSRCCSSWRSCAGLTPARRATRSMSSGCSRTPCFSSVPLILGAMAGLLCERTGVINVAIEGQMLVGAFAGALGSSVAKNLGVGILFAVIAGGLLGAHAGRVLDQVPGQPGRARRRAEPARPGPDRLPLRLADGQRLGHLQQRHDAADVPHPGPGRHPDHRQAAVRRERHRLRDLRHRDRHRHRVVPDPLGLADAGRRRASEGG